MGQSFTRQKQGEVDYDDAAYAFYAVTLLGTLITPWAYKVARNYLSPGYRELRALFPVMGEGKKSIRYPVTSPYIKQKEQMVQKTQYEARKPTLFRAARLSLLTFLIYIVLINLGSLQGMPEIKTFDPYSVLDVGRTATSHEIKKATKRKAFEHSPDNPKNHGDPLAVARFLEVTKAKKALLDKEGRANFDRYGNPDGNESMSVGIGLPSWLMSDDYQLMVLFAFFFLFLVVLPALSISYYQSQKDYDLSGVTFDTLEFFGHYVKDTLSQRGMIELLAACRESRSLAQTGYDEEYQVLEKSLKGSMREDFKKNQGVHRNFLLLSAYFQRHQLPAPLEAHQRTLLSALNNCASALIGVGCVQDNLQMAQKAIDFRAHLVQALPVDDGFDLLQIPHFKKANHNEASKGKLCYRTLLEFRDYWVKKGNCFESPEGKKGMPHFTPEEYHDVKLFEQVLPDNQLETTVRVVGEKEIVESDVITITVNLTRAHLKEDELQGHVHAPFFPEPLQEELFCFLCLSGQRIVSKSSNTSQSRSVSFSLQFRPNRVGKNTVNVYVMSDSYVGLNVKKEVTFNVLRESEAKRERFVHQEDIDLDKEPTLFQLMMGGVPQEEDEYDSSYDDEDKEN